ncbi:UDP-N-acetylmuramoyl-L-alanyl-D-glutamate--2,6-diaminopimelate ligase [Patescibacteria group bacterium]|nr:UDP-N-acetylmuramoyl-L-alanyl-D-glutamate--2,6-diaminopimelate ligase [Patescibacteria group bacterium]
MKQFIREFIPLFILQSYHWLLAGAGAWRYGHPSRRLIVIGVTGTKGKSSVVTLVTKILEANGHKVGAIATTHFKIGDREWVNDTKQTMPGRWRLQQLIKQMVKAGCQYAVIETSSEGIAQYRHLGIDYDVALFTSLSPEHIESHGSYAKYRQAKLRLFYGLAHSYRKSINGQDIKKIIIANNDDQEVQLFINPEADAKWTFGLNADHKIVTGVTHNIVGHDLSLRVDGISFTVNGQIFNLNLLGKFNVYNALSAITIGLALGIALPIMKEALEGVRLIPGRLEEIVNRRGFKIFVDYAHEPASLEAAYQAMTVLKPKKIISILGSQGGGRDKAKRPQLGALAAQYADVVIVTNEDPYDESPQQIIDEVVSGAIKNGKVLDENCFSVIDRRAALQKGLSLAGEGDIVIVTGKGSETVMAVAGGKMIPWDDRQVIRELLG